MADHPVCHLIPSISMRLFIYVICCTTALWATLGHVSIKPTGDGGIPLPAIDDERSVQAHETPEANASSTESSVGDGGGKPISILNTVTAYNSVEGQTDSTPCIAASNEDICQIYEAGLNVCASNDYKLGTALHVEGLGDCIVLDRMNSRYTGKKRIDWYFGMDVKAAKQFGVQLKKVTIY